MFTKKLNKLIFILGCLVFNSTFAASWDSIEHWHTKNDIPVSFIHTDEPGIVDVVIAWRAGSAYDGDSKGLANITSELLTTATDNLETEQVAEKVDDLGVSIGEGADRDMSWVNMRMLSDPEVVSRASQLFGDLISSMKFSSKDFNRVKDDALAEIKAREQSPSSVAIMTFFKALYGNHPYASPIVGTTNTVKLIKNSEVHDFYNKYYGAKNAKISIVGQLTSKQAKLLSNTISAKLAKGQLAQSISEPKALTKSMVVNKCFPSEQTHSLMGNLAVSYINPDRLKLKLANGVLGGNDFTSMLYKEIRDKSGLAYSAYSAFISNKVPGPFIMIMQTRNNKAQAAINKTKNIFDGFVKNGVTKSAIDGSVNDVINSFPLSLATNESIISQLVTVDFYNLGDDYLSTYVDKIKSYSVDQINTALKQWADSKQLLTVTVGGINCQGENKK